MNRENDDLSQDQTEQTTESAPEPPPTTEYVEKSDDPDCETR